MTSRPSWFREGFFLYLSLELLIYYDKITTMENILKNYHANKLPYTPYDRVSLCNTEALKLRISNRILNHEKKKIQMLHFYSHVEDATQLHTAEFY